MAAYFHLKRAPSGALSFTLKAGNHEVILSSPMHPNDADARAAIAQVRRNSQRPERFKRMTAKDKSPYFVLVDESGKTLGTSEMYSSAPAMENGIRSVMSNGAATNIKEPAA